MQVAVSEPEIRRWRSGSTMMNELKGLSRREIADIYQTYGALMRRRCLFVIKSDSLAEDVLQTVFVNLIRYGGGFRKATSKLAFLYTTCDRACWALIDKRKRRDVREHAYISPKPAPAAEQIANRDLVLKVLDCLEPDHRQLAMLLYVDGVSQGKAGEKLGVSRQTINKRVKEITQLAQQFSEETE